MILLNRKQIKYLHSKIIQEIGGSNGISDSMGACKRISHALIGSAWDTL